MDMSRYNQGEDLDKLKIAQKRLISPDGSVISMASWLLFRLARLRPPFYSLRMEEGNAPGGAAPSTSTTPGKAPIVKRRRHGTGEESEDTYMINEAASFEDFVLELPWDWQPYDG